MTIFSKSKFLRNFFLKLSQNFGNFERLRYLRTSISVQILTQFFLTKFLIKHYFAVQNRPKKAHFGPKMGQNWPYFGPRNRQKVAILGSKIGSRFWQNLHRLQGSEKRPFADKSAELATLYGINKHSRENFKISPPTTLIFSFSQLRIATQ